MRPTYLAKPLFFLFFFGFWKDLGFASFVAKFVQFSWSFLSFQGERKGKSIENKREGCPLFERSTLLHA